VDTCMFRTVFYAEDQVWKWRSEMRQPCSGVVADSLGIQFVVELRLEQQNEELSRSVCQWKASTEI